MKPRNRVIVPVGLVVLVSIALTRHWYANPNTFPKLLTDFGLTAISLLGIQGAETAADVEAAYVIVVALVAASLLIFGATAVWRHVFRRNDHPLGGGGLRNPPNREQL